MACASLSAIPPIAEYVNGENGRCSITGGYVYRGSRRSLPYGAYIFGDYCTGEIFTLVDGAPTLLLDSGQNISSFGEDESGELYVVGHGGQIFRIASTQGAAVTERAFSVSSRGALFLPSIDGGAALATGSAVIQADDGSSRPGGVAIFGLRKNGTLVSEASVPAVTPVVSGRISASSGAVMTGIAIVNPNAEPVTLNFYFTDANGVDFGASSTVIPARVQLAGFLNEAPFNGGQSLDGAFTFQASMPVAAVALQGRIGARAEFLMTALPIVALSPVFSSAATVFPHWARGAGWETEFVLVNPGDTPLSGIVDVAGVAALPYAIPAKTSRRLRLPDQGGAVESGSARIVPASSEAPPAGLAIFRLNTAEGVIAEAGVLAATTGAAFRTYAEISTAVRTSLAIVNDAPSPGSVTVELTKTDGTPLPETGTIELAASGRAALFIDEIPGLTAMTTPFQGMVRVTANRPIAITSLRGRVNERSEFLITAIPPEQESFGFTSGAAYFPHFAVGGGYDMQFVLVNTHPGVAPQSGVLAFWGRDGQPGALPVP